MENYRLSNPVVDDPLHSSAFVVLVVDFEVDSRFSLLLSQVGSLRFTAYFAKTKYM
jgi:hypothetical protein